MKCHFCRGKVVWQSDFNPDEVIDCEEGEPGVVAFLTCSECGAEY